MVWNDEFDGAALNASKYSHDVNCDGGDNNEQQCYTASGDNSWVAGGVLTLKAMPSPGYSSTRISSKNKGYGKFEARINCLRTQQEKSNWSAAPRFITAVASGK
ncbi:Beta-glucanase [Diplonema papillatum]|nr:Beta-glucanase [Diplonema papillatum]